eukprot:1088102-Prorocentrum_minimum.AAC.1
MVAGAQEEADTPKAGPSSKKSLASSDPLAPSLLRAQANGRPTRESPGLSPALNLAPAPPHNPARPRSVLRFPPRAAPCESARPPLRSDSAPAPRGCRRSASCAFAFRSPSKNSPKKDAENAGNKRWFQYQVDSGEGDLQRVDGADSDSDGAMDTPAGMLSPEKFAV